MFAPGPLLAKVLDHPEANNYRLIYHRMKDDLGILANPFMRVQEDLDIDGQTISATMRRAGTQGVSRRDGANLELNLRAEFDCDGEKGVVDEHLAVATYQNPGRAGVTAVIDITLPGQLPEATRQMAIGCKFGTIVEMKGILELYADYTITDIFARTMAGCDPDIRFTLNDGRRRQTVRRAFLEFLKTRSAT